MSDDLNSNIAEVRRRIEQAAARSGRTAGDIELVAVTKTHRGETVREAVAAGITVFGENKVQEAESKIEELGRDTITWHLIGHLQSNKARRAVQLFDTIQSVDSLELARRLERICREEGRPSLPVYVQVDLAGEETKSGIALSELDALVEYLGTCEHLLFDGLMVLPPFFDDAEMARPFFRELRLIRDDLASKNAFATGTGH
ncbi:MAG TPA: YggS family pyridoxal phosphate-dependent enzyme, partial [Pyrinomonadaceae bacterium]|nr:YggS family pyridoxal phosphate-dependent enzyme [Pyrinomonadaceae bacterium]